nr:hypothetical protein [uncultured Methanocorpusculum sp.]
MLAAVVITAFLFLPIIPIGAPPGKMGCEFRTPADMLHGITFPENPPTKLPVYQVIKFKTGTIHLDTDKYRYPENVHPTLKEAREIYQELIKKYKHLNIQVPGEEKFKTLYWSFLDAGNAFYDFIYGEYTVVKVGEIDIMSPDEAIEQLKLGKGIAGNCIDRDTLKVTPLKDPSLAWFNRAAIEFEYMHGWYGKIDSPYLTPNWLFSYNDGRGYRIHECTVNAVDGSIDINWSPEGNPKFTPNEKFYELKNQKPKYCRYHFAVDETDTDPCINA